MNERSLTPSPLRSQNLERGVFSSLSTLSLYKQAVEERKLLQSSVTSIKKSPLSKPRSPLRVRPIVKKIEKSPETTARSPLKINNKTREESEIRIDVEMIKLQENVKSLNLQLAREKRMNLKLEAEIKEVRSNHALEIANFAGNSEKMQKTLQGLIGNNAGLTGEKEKVLEELKKIKEKYEECKEQLRLTGGLLVSVLNTFFSNFDEDLSLAGQERLRIGAKIKEIVAEKLEEISFSQGIDLSRQISEVHSWLLVRNLPKQLEKPKFLKDPPAELSYIVEYFDEITENQVLSDQLLNSTSKNLQNYHEEVSFNEAKSAIALYDFEGEREEDLAFFSGDTIEIIEECESGWWIGRLHGKSGSFPYNFVQII